MAIKLKRKLIGADGGKHPHLKNGQDFSPDATALDWPTPRIAKANLDTAMAMLQSKPVKEALGHHVTLANALNEIRALMHLLGE